MCLPPQHDIFKSMFVLNENMELIKKLKLEILELKQEIKDLKIKRLIIEISN